MNVIQLAEKNLIPDPLLRYGIRRRLRQRLDAERAQVGPDPTRAVERFAQALTELPIAVNVADANEQHYELPARFYELVLGPRLKYSGSLWASGVSSLAGAEEAMLDLYARRAEIQDGQRILDLGCGWGSFSLYAAERFPAAHVIAVSNSRSQRTFIEDRARALGLSNLRVITEDMNSFHIDERFDRVVSIEMFEHMKNYRALLAKIRGFLEPHGRLFVHIFTHASHPYHFEPRSPGDWMARYFFTGGLMPSHDLLVHFQEDLRLVRRWRVDGTHYRKTANAWLANMDRHRQEIEPILASTYGERERGLWWARWRLFFMACAELFGYARGTEWQVSHYLFEAP
jgi:cyclopropane-fatty-acyl-phospholipid synthase